ENLEFVHAFQAINLNGLDRHVVRNVIGQAFSIGILIDAVVDVGRLENIQLAPYWSGFSQDGSGAVTPAIAAYQFANGTAYWIKGTDGQMVTNCYAKGHTIGVHIAPTDSPDPMVMPEPNCQVQGLTVETCQTGVLIDIGDVEAGLQFTNF